MELIDASPLRACQKLRDPNPATVAALVEMLRDSDHRVRHEATWRLVDLEEKSKIPALAKALQGTDPVLRVESARTLYEMGHSPFGDAIAAKSDLLNALTDRVEQARVWAACALSRLEVEDPEVLVVLTSGLNSCDEKVLNTALRGLIYLESGCREFLVLNKRPNLVNGLLGLLKHKSAHFRAQAAGLLGSCGDKSEKVIAGLTTALADPESRVRSGAADSFSHLLPAKCPDPVFVVLCDDLKRHECFDNRHFVYWAMKRINQFPPCVVETLTQRLDESPKWEWQDRLEAACLLSRHPSNANAKLEQVLVELDTRYIANWFDRVKVLEALGRLGPKSIEARHVVEKATKDDREEVRTMAERILKTVPQ